MFTCDAAIFVQCDFALFKYIVECRPAATRIILCIGSEEILVAHDTLIDALLIKFIVFASEWAFGARFLCHLILDWCQATAKRLFCFHFVSAERTTKWATNEVKRFTDGCGNNWNTEQKICPLKINFSVIKFNAIEICGTIAKRLIYLNWFRIKWLQLVCRRDNCTIEEDCTCYLVCKWIETDHDSIREQCKQKMEWNALNRIN